MVRAIDFQGLQPCGAASSRSPHHVDVWNDGLDQISAFTNFSEVTSASSDLLLPSRVNLSTPFLFLGGQVSPMIWPSFPRSLGHPSIPP